MRFRTAPLLIALVLLTGCAANVKRGSADSAAPSIPVASASRLVLNLGGTQQSIGAGDWEGFKLEWKENFAEQTKLSGIAFQFQEGAPVPTGEDGTLLSVFIEDYRFLRPGTRYAIGIMSGNAYIESRLTFSDLKTGAPFGVQTANTSSSAWEGVFSAMTAKQVEAIAADVVRQMKAGRPGKSAD